MSAAEMRTNLQDVSLAWWPEFLLTMDNTPSDEDSFIMSLANLAARVSEEDSLA